MSPPKVQSPPVGSRDELSLSAGESLRNASDEFATKELKDVIVVLANLVPEKDSSPESTQLEDKLAKFHDNILPQREIICLVSLSTSLFVSFCDQSSVTTALPQIAKDLNAADSIN